MITESQFKTFAAYLNALCVKQAYRVAHECDAQFSRELVRVYGRRRAADARYLPMHKYTDLPLLHAQARKLAADRRLLDMLREAA